MELEESLRRLVGIPSPTGMEADMVKPVTELMEMVGLEVTCQPVDKNRSNVIGRVGTGSTLVYCTHLDTIPSGPAELWKHAPHGGEVQDGYLYGRGACDAKGQLVAVLCAVEAIATEPPCEVVVAAVVDEESGSSAGAKRFLESTSPDAAVICEPTELAICTSHRGSIKPEIIVYGEPTIDIGTVSTNTVINEIIGTIKSLERHGLFVVGVYDPSPSKQLFTVTILSDYGQLGMFQQTCSVSIDRRLVSTVAMSKTMGEVRRRLEIIAGKYGVKLDVKIALQYTPTSTPADDGFIMACMNARRELSGMEEPGEFPAGCDMWSFREKGVPTVIFGPGRLEDTHCIDERISLIELEKGVKVYNAIAHKWAGTYVKG